MLLSHLFIYSLMDTWFGPTFWLLYIMLLWLFMYKWIYLRTVESHWKQDFFDVDVGQDATLDHSVFQGVQFSSVQSLSCVWIFGTPWTTPHQASMSITNSKSLLKLMSIKWVMPSNHLILCCPLLLLPSIFPTIRVFSSESVPHTTWPKYWSFSFQWIFRTDFLEDGLVGSFCSPRDSQKSSTTPHFKSINSSALSFLYSPILTSIHDYWKNHSFD